MKRKCDRCVVKNDGFFNTIVMYDYAEPGKKKPRHYHLYLNC